MCESWKKNWIPEFWNPGGWDRTPGGWFVIRHRNACVKLLRNRWTVENFLILEFSKSEFRIPDGWVPAAGGGFFHPPFNCPCQTTQDSVKIWKYLNSGIPASGRMNFGWEYVYSLLPDGNDPEAKNPDPIGAFLSKFRIPATNPESGEKSGIRRMSCWTADWCRLRGRGKLFTTCTDTFLWPAVACRYFSSPLSPSLPLSPPFGAQTCTDTFLSRGSSLKLLYQNHLIKLWLCVDNLIFLIENFILCIRLIRTMIYLFYEN